MRVLITGGAGFVGAYLARAFREEVDAKVVAFDSLRRRGSELNLPLLRELGIEFLHGDVRIASDLEGLAGDFDLLIDAAAEPSVLAGVSESPRYVLDTNLQGTLNCLEFARSRGAALLLLSTSRVYSIPALKQIRLVETPKRFMIGEHQSIPGVTPRGVAETFPVDGPRSFYGGSKLASEIVTQEYVAAYGLKAIINRCGVIAGPGQFGKVDQGVFTMWILHHYFKKPIRYTGFGGQGKQVRDLLHPRDLFALIRKQIEVITDYSGLVFNVGGGIAVSTSLAELTDLCRERLGAVPISSALETSWVDVPLYISDSAKVQEAFGWKPVESISAIVADIIEWIKDNETVLQGLQLPEPA